MTVGGNANTAVLPVTLPRRPPDRMEIAGGAGLGLGVAALAGLAVMRRRRRNMAETPIPVAFLKFLDSNGHTLPITATRVTIGRGAEGNEIDLANDSVSRHHATILRRRDGEFEIRDLMSANGVEVNDRKVEHAQLAEGDLIGLGEVRFHFHLAKSDGERP